MRLLQLHTAWYSKELLAKLDSN